MVQEIRVATSDPDVVDMIESPSPMYTPYLGFWHGGFEGADHTNGSGTILCLKSMTDHLRRADDDYQALSLLGIQTVRESLSWRQVDRDGRYDFSEIDLLENAARRHGIQILWTLCHYGIPTDTDFFDAGFAERFAGYCGAAASHIRRHHPGERARIYTPINEISFLAWAVCETGLVFPHKGDRREDGYLLKMKLVEAAIRGANAILAEDPSARMLAVDPLIHVAGSTEDYSAEANARTVSQYQAWDMLSGATEPQLGGSARHLDLIGVNYYPANQWTLPDDDVPGWPYDSRRRRLSSLLVDVWKRYGRPITISETSDLGPRRGEWISHVAGEVRIAQRRGVPISGVCVYPIMNRPDWEDPTQWHDSGLWMVDPVSFERSAHAGYSNALSLARAFLQPSPIPPSPPLSPSSPIAHPDQTPMNAPAISTLIVFCHLRWDFVYQRPQHLLSRLAKHYEILVVEEPTAGELGYSISEPSPGVRVFRATMPEGGHGFSDDAIATLEGLLDDYLEASGTDNYGMWFYTPMALPLLRHFKPVVVLYDCMDELSGFKNAPTQLVAREATLLRVSNAVFTGGPSLYEAKKDRADSVHCFPSSVDATHFSSAADPGIQNPMYQSLGRPRLGYYGVIDERLDIELVKVLAEQNPHWQICIVGPVVKIDPATLPQLRNIHYFPQQSYEDLPSSLAAWDVCLLPFALNEATRFISPTKTLEYMCAEKPVVSTAIRDVESLYGAGVTVAASHADFVAACRRALVEDSDSKAERIERQRELVAATSWDKTADAMAGIISGANRQGLTEEAQHYMAQHQVVDLVPKLRAHANDRSTACLVVGAGPTGLSAAMHYGADSILVESNETVGGWCRSIDDAGFTFDYAGHIMFSNDSYVLGLYEKLLGDNLHWQDREAWVYSKEVYTRYPFQGALYGLPTEVLKECIVGAIEARFGALSGAVNGEIAPPAACDAKGTGEETDKTELTDCCADGAVALESAEGDVKDAVSGSVSTLSAKRAPANFEDFIYQVWGAGVAKHFAVPYNTKLWTVPLKDMETSWLGGRVPLPNLEEMIDGALRPVSAPVGPNARFGYPLRGGFQALMEGFLPHLEGELMLGRRLVSVHPNGRTAVLDNGARISYETMISTIPLPDLVALIGDEAPEHIHRAAAGLKHVSVKCVNLGIGRANLTDKHWIYFPEDTVFHRIFVQGNASPYNNPQGGFGLTCEITYSPTKPLPCDGQELIDRCIRECIEVGIFNQDDAVLAANVVDMPYAYVIYDHHRAENVSRIRSWLSSKGIVLAGRYSEWEYYNSDHAFIAGKRAAEAVAGLADTGTQ